MQRKQSSHNIFRSWLNLSLYNCYTMLNLANTTLTLADTTLTRRASIFTVNRGKYFLTKQISH